MGEKHKTAVIASGAQVADSASIGAFCVIEDDVTIGENTIIEPHTTVFRQTAIGDDNHIHSYCSIGGAPQHQADDGVKGELIIGNGNVIREFCTVNRGTVDGGGKTVIGDHSWLLAYAHVAHDCILGNHVLLVNSATLGGHVEVGDYAVLGGLTLVHQFCRVGCHAFTGRVTALVQDLAPYTMATGSPSSTKGLNLTGLKRRGFSKETLDALTVAYKHCLRKQRHIDAETVAALAAKHPEVKIFMDFIATSKRGVVV